MELKRLDRRVLKLWYIRAVCGAVILIGVFAAAFLTLDAADASKAVFFAVSLSAGIPLVFLLSSILLLPYFRYKRFAWGYDSKTIVVKQGVIFRKRTVIPICQIQDLHRNQGPLMIALKLSNVTISTAGSNFDISTLTTCEADALIDHLEALLEARIEELQHEEI